ncbi:MAG: hypothetical protein ABI707_17355 [Ferruginibacter sp.]
MAAKKKRSSIPRYKKMRRAQRLDTAISWIEVSPGKNIVKGYANHFAVDPVTAIIELRMLGFTISADYESSVKQSIKNRSRQKKMRKEQKTKFDEVPGVNSDADFAFIAGYTSGEVPGHSYKRSWH